MGRKNPGRHGFGNLDQQERSIRWHETHRLLRGRGRGGLGCSGGAASRATRRTAVASARGTVRTAVVPAVAVVVAAARTAAVLVVPAGLHVAGGKSGSQTGRDIRTPQRECPGTHLICHFLATAGPRCVGWESESKAKTSLRVGQGKEAGVDCKAPVEARAPWSRLPDIPSTRSPGRVSASPAIAPGNRVAFRCSRSTMRSKSRPCA